MERFEYDITMHASDSLNNMIYFCTEKGECSVDDVPVTQIDVLKNVLNLRGDDGWEALQIFPGKDGIMVIWKRRI